MSLGSSYLARKKKSNSSSIKSQISLSHITNGIIPILEMVKLLKPRDEVISIDFDWHNIKDDICPITINVRKEASKTK